MLVILKESPRGVKTEGLYATSNDIPLCVPGRCMIFQTLTYPLLLCCRSCRLNVKTFPTVLYSVCVSPSGTAIITRL